jgi:MoxR-like ATPase
MQERTVSYAGVTHALPSPFFVLATQNPLEQAGTYPLPEAQLDRFLLHIRVEYPSEREEYDILAQTTGTASAQVPQVMHGRRSAGAAGARARSAPGPGSDGVDHATRAREPPGRASHPRMSASG